MDARGVAVCSRLVPERSETIVNGPTSVICSGAPCRPPVDRARVQVVGDRAVAGVEGHLAVVARELQATHDATIVLTTHDLDEAERLCGRITILDGGRTVAEDSPAGLIAAEATRTATDATLHDVFMKYTGRSLDEDVEEESDDDTD